MAEFKPQVTFVKESLLSVIASFFQQIRPQVVVRVRAEQSLYTTSMQRTIYITADHGGYALKNALVKHLTSQGNKVVDLGPQVEDPTDDYPDYVLELVKHMRQDDYGLGIIACRSAEGVAMAANRNPDIRAAVAWTTEVAEKSRQHNNANVLCLSGDFVDEQTDKAIADAWLAAEFTREPRHVRRLQKIESYFPY